MLYNAITEKHTSFGVTGLCTFLSSSLSTSMYLWGPNIWLDFFFLHIAVTSNISLWNSLNESEIQVTTHFSKMLALRSTSAETVFPWFAWNYKMFQSSVIFLYYLYTIILVFNILSILLFYIISFYCNFSYILVIFFFLASIYLFFYLFFFVLTKHFSFSYIFSSNIYILASFQLTKAILIVS